MRDVVLIASAGALIIACGGSQLSTAPETSAGIGPSQDTVLVVVESVEDDWAGAGWNGSPARLAAGAEPVGNCPASFFASEEVHRNPEGLLGLEVASSQQVVLTVVGWTGSQGCETGAEWSVSSVAHGAVFLYEGGAGSPTNPGEVLEAGGHLVTMRGWAIVDGEWVASTEPVAAVLERGLVSEDVACVQHDTPEAADRLATALIYEEFGSPAVRESSHHDLLELADFHGGPLRELFNGGAAEFPPECLASPVFRAATLSFGAEPSALDMSRSPAVLTLHASNAYDRMDWEIVAEAIAAALSQSPGYGPALYLRGRLEEEVNINLVAAGDAYAAAAGDERLRAAASYRLGLISEDVGELDAARAQYSTAAESDPTFAEPANALGFLAFEAGDFGSARIMFEEALARAPGFAQAANNLGYIAENVDGDPVTAVTWYRRAAEIDPESASTLVNLAAVLAHHLGDVAEAERLLRQAMALDARNSDALASLEALSARPSADPATLAGTWGGTRSDDGATLTVTFGADGSAAIVTRPPGGEPRAERFSSGDDGAHRTQRVFGETDTWTVETISQDSAYLYRTDAPTQRTLLSRRDGGVAIAL